MQYDNGILKSWLEINDELKGRYDNINITFKT